MASSALLLCGCGYTLVRPDAPFGIQQIKVDAFVEDVPLGLSADLARSLRERLAAGGVILTEDRARASGVITGTIVSARTAPSPTSTGLGARVTAYRISVQVRAALVDTSGATLWSSVLMLSEDFLPAPVSGDGAVNATLATETSRRRALRRLADAVARELHSQLVLAGSRYTSPARKALRAQHIFRLRRNTGSQSFDELRGEE